MHLQTDMHLLSYLAQFFLEWEMFQAKVVEKIKTHFVFSNFFRKFCHFQNNMKKYCTVGQEIDDNMTHAHCMLDT